MTASAFDRLHPVVPLLSLAAILVVTFISLNPTLIATSLVLAVCYSLLLHGPRRVMRGALWQLPVIILIAVINPFFSAQGSTLLATPVPGHPIFFESLIFGLCMGAMLIAVLLWFSCVSTVLGSDKVMCLASGRFPTLTLMLSMTLRLVPQLVQRGRLIAQTEGACTAAGGTGAGRKLSGRMRQVSVLMGWSMEDSLEMADARKVRGWGSGKRTSYRRGRMRARDWCWVVAILALFVLTVVFYVFGGRCSFYPVLDIPCPWWLLFTFVLLCALPVVGECVDRLSWRLAR